MTKLITKVQNAIAVRRMDEKGAAMVEYGLLVALIALVAAVGTGLLGDAIDALFTDAAGDVVAP